jgi:HEAT repeat protein
MPRLEKIEREAASVPAGPPQYLGKPLSYWRQRLRHPRPECAAKAAWVVGRMGAGAESAVPDLLKVIDESDEPEIKSAAMNTLGKVGPAAKAAVPKLVDILSGEGDPAAAIVLGRIRAEREIVVPALVKALGDKDWGVRETAAAGLGIFAAKVQLGTQADPAISALGKALDNESAHVRSAALFALWEVGPAADAMLKKACESGRAEIREIAALALKAVGPTTIRGVHERVPPPNPTLHLTAAASRLFGVQRLLRRRGR